MTLMLITIALIGSVLCLDRIYFQSLVSRPVVTGAIIGLILQDLRTGVMIGALLELLWIDQSPIGTMVPPNDTISTIVITASCVLAGQSTGEITRELISLSLLLMLPAAILGRQLDIFIYKRNDGLSRIAVSCGMRGDIRGVEREHRLAVLKTFVLSGLLILITLIAGFYALAGLYSLLPEKIMKALTYVYYFVPLLGIAAAMNTINLKRTIPVFCGVFLVLTILLDLVS